MIVIHTIICQEENSRKEPLIYPNIRKFWSFSIDFGDKYSDFSTPSLKS